MTKKLKLDNGGGGHKFRAPNRNFKGKFALQKRKERLPSPFNFLHFLAKAPAPEVYDPGEDGKDAEGGEREGEGNARRD